MSNTSAEENRKIGHNKFQLEIEQLKTEIEKHIYTNNEKEMKLSLYKQNIANLQLQLQERHAHIQSLEESLKNTNTPIINTNVEGFDKLQNDINLKDSIISDLNSKILLFNENELHTKNKIDCLTEENTILKNTIDKTNNNTFILQEQNDLLQSKIVQQTNIINSLETEIKNIKDELVTCNQLLTINKEQLYELIENEKNKTNDPVIPPIQPIHQNIQAGVVRKKITRGERRR